MAQFALVNLEARGAAPLVEEVTHLSGHHEQLRLHLIDTEVSPA